MAHRGNRKPPSPLGDPNDPLGMGHLAEQFLDWMRVRNFSQDTIVNRRALLCYFIDWCADRGLVRPGEITRSILERYLRFLHQYRKRNGEPLGTQTKVGRLVAARAWFKWLAKEKHIASDPSAELELPLSEKHLPKCILTESEAEQIINQAKVAEPLGIRNRAILEMLYSTGIRRRELIELKPVDVDADRGTIFIRQGKGHKDRVVPIGERALAWLEKYLNEVRPGLLIGDGGAEVLFLTKRGRAFNPTSLTDLVTKYVKAANLAKGGSCHLMRHTAATLMLENGADIRYIQAMLGHECLDSTQIYTQVSIGKLKKVHDATHPARMARKPNAGTDSQ